MLEIVGSEVQFNGLVICKISEAEALRDSLIKFFPLEVKEAEAPVKEEGLTNGE